jgi:serine phosphatase RsbU (regulator of sigma subunit)
MTKESLTVTNNLIELKPDKMPVAIYAFMDSFKEEEYQYYPGDAFYLFSDGDADQFGGPKGKKFMSKHMKELFLNISQLPMEKQKEEIETAFMKWKEGYEQVDDVLVIGVRL